MRETTNSSSAPARAPGTGKIGYVLLLSAVPVLVVLGAATLALALVGSTAERFMQH